MYRAAVIGDRDSIYGFAALGLEVFPVTDSEMGSKTLRRLAEGEYAVIYITEALAAELEHELDHFRLQPLPAIIPIPGDQSLVADAHNVEHVRVAHTACNYERTGYFFDCALAHVLSHPFR